MNKRYQFDGEARRSPSKLEKGNEIEDKNGDILALVPHQAIMKRIDRTKKVPRSFKVDGDDTEYTVVGMCQFDRCLIPIIEQLDDYVIVEEKPYHIHHQPSRTRQASDEE